MWKFGEYVGICFSHVDVHICLVHMTGCKMRFRGHRVYRGQDAGVLLIEHLNLNVSPGSIPGLRPRFTRAENSWC